MKYVGKSVSADDYLTFVVAMHNGIIYIMSVFSLIPVHILEITMLGCL